MDITKNLGAAAIVAVVLAIVATVLAFIFIVPENKRKKLGSFGKFLHDTVNFKYLIIEKILQALYIFATSNTILLGFIMLFMVVPKYGSYYFSDESMWLGGYGLLIMILGPIVIRLVYELLMMSILLVKNVISINSKLKSDDDSNSHDIFATPDMSNMTEAIKQKIAAKSNPQMPTANFCISCGCRLNPDGTCPNCGR